MMSETVYLLTALHGSNSSFLLFLLLLILSQAFTLSPSQSINIHQMFPHDHLTPYPPGRHGAKRSIREISSCVHTTWKNRTFETFKVSKEPPVSEEVSYQLHKFADITQRPLGPTYLVGTITYVDEPYHTFSVLEPNSEGGCSNLYYGASRSTVSNTVSDRVRGCKLAANGGYFVMVSGQCLGNIVSDGRIVQTADNQQNVNFGIREDGTIVVGYIPDEDILNTTNPFRQLVTGVIWLVRNGTNYVNESKKLECADHEDTGRMDTFVDVISARSALGHDVHGRLVMAQVEGQTHRRGANLIEFADLLIRHGVVNAVNLDGGGSNTLLQNNVLVNYPSDHCVGDGQYRCQRAVSTALCIHDVQCLDPECRGHGVCEGTKCICEPPWIGVTCDTLNCSSTNCSGRGNCTDGSCVCEDGWTGELCDQACPSNRYGKDCNLYCWCYGKAYCHPTSGHCVCPPGYDGYNCMHECEEGYYGAGCTEECPFPDCSGHGHCSKLNGTCLCNEGWTGLSCSIRSDEVDGSGSQDLSPFSSSTILSPSLLHPTHTITTSHHRSVSTNVFVASMNTPNSTCNCSRLCSGGEGVNCSIRNENCNKTINSSTVLSREDADTLQWAVAISLLIALLTLVIHTLLCYITRCWAYRRAYRGLSNVEEVRLSSSEKRKKLKRRKPRPKFRTPLMLHYSSSTDCSL